MMKKRLRPLKVLKGKLMFHKGIIFSYSSKNTSQKRLYDMPVIIIVYEQYQFFCQNLIVNLHNKISNHDTTGNA